MRMLVECAAQLEAASDVEELWKGAVAALNDCGFEHVLYITVSADFTDPVVHCTLPGLYDEVPPENDPFLYWACNSYDILMIGAEFVDGHPYISDQERHFIERAGRAGFRAALGIPMRLKGSNRFGGFIVGNGLDHAAFLNRMVPMAEEVRLFCLLIHRRLEELAETDVSPSGADFRHRLVAPDLPPEFDALSPREREVIYLLAHGRSRQQTADTCGISVHTVSDYAKSGYRKLGVHNRAQAAALIHAALPMPGNPAAPSGP